MSQQNIDFGTFPDDPDADAIRTAFQKVQNNFDELFATATAGSVTSVNRGAGIDVNSPTGNVIVTANLAQVVVNTSSLSIGRGSNGGTSATITTSAQILVIDINPANVFSGNFSGVSGALANLNGTLTSNSNSQPNITTVGTLGNLSVTGNVTSGNVYANSGTIGAVNLTGTLTTGSQPNITSTGTLGNLSVTGNITGSNITASPGGKFIGDGSGLTGLVVTAGSSIISGSSNVTVELNGNVNTTSAGNANIVVVTGTGSNVNGYLTVTGNISGGNANLGNAVTANYFIGNLYGNANTAGTVTTNAQPNITSVGTLTSLTVTGNITSGNVYANSGLIKAQYLSGDGSNLTNLSAGVTLVNGNSNVNIPNANGNINMSAVGNANILIITGTGINVAGTINATGTITGNLSGNIITASQGNITSLGTLTGLNVNGTANLGAVGNVKITGSAGFLQSDGSGNLSFSSPITQVIPGTANTVLLSSGSNTIISSGNIKFNDPQLDITGTLSVTGNANVGNLGATLITGTLTTASNQQSNIKLVGTLDYLIINTTGYLSMGAGNITAGNITLTATGSANLGNSATANYFIGSGNNLSNIQGSNVTGAVSSATTAGTVTTAAQGNITSVGTLTGLGVNGTVTAVNFTSNTGVFAGSGANLTTLNASNISSGTLAQARLANASVTLGSTALTLGSTVTTVAGLSSVTSTTFVGALTGAATTAGSATTAGTVTTAAQPNITSTGTLTGVTVSGTSTLGSGATGDIVVLGAEGKLNNSGTNISLYGNTGAGLRLGTNGSLTNGIQISTAGVVTTTGNLSVGGTLSGSATGLTSIPGANVTGTVANATYATSAGSATTATTAGTVTTAAQPNITSVGTLTSLTLGGTLTGAVQIGTGTATHYGTTLTTGANSTAGTITGNWSLSAGSRLNATYADLAEKYVADAEYHPGTVLVFGGDHEVTLSTSSDSFRVAGVVTTNPAYTMNNNCVGEHVATIALQGRVPVKVIGPIFKGDLLVSCDNGHAIANNIARAGTIIGKSLENFTDSSGVIEVAVGRF